MDCPHCSVDIPNVLTQETLEGRINSIKDAKQGEINLLTTSLAEAKTKAAGYDSMKTAHDAAVAKIAAMETATARSTALASAGITDAGKLAGIEAIFASQNAGLADADKLDFAAWIADADGARMHPLLAPHFNGAPGVPAGDAAEAAAASSAASNGAESASSAASAAGTGAGLPDSSAGNPGNPPNTVGKMTPGQVSEYFNSAEFQAMKPEDRKAKTAEMKAQYLS